jgi:hypothetical protein
VPDDFRMRAQLLRQAVIEGERADQVPGAAKLLGIPFGSLAQQAKDVLAPHPGPRMLP